MTTFVALDLDILIFPPPLRSPSPLFPFPLLQPEFVASNQWLKRFKARYQNLEVRYSHQLRNNRIKMVGLLRQIGYLRACRWGLNKVHPLIVHVSLRGAHLDVL